MKPRLIHFFLCAVLTNSASAGISVIGSLARSKNVQPGEMFEGSILVRNNGTNACEVRVFQTDYLSYCDGRNFYGEPGRTPRSNAGWFTVSPSRLPVAAGETLSVHYKGAVPGGADLHGTYWSMVMVEPSAAEAPAADPKDGEVKIGIRSVIRYGVQIVTEIGEAGNYNIKVLDKQLVTKDGRRKLQLDIENTGDRLLVPSIWAELYDQKGLSIGKFEAAQARLYPTCSVRHWIDLSEVPRGKYSALAIVDNGDDHVMGAQYELTLD